METSHFSTKLRDELAAALAADVAASRRVMRESAERQMTREEVIVALKTAYEGLPVPPGIGDRVDRRTHFERFVTACITTYFGATGDR